MLSLFKKTSLIIQEIDDFFNVVDEGALIFRNGVRHYLEKNETDFENDLQRIRAFEGKADSLRRSIRNALYSHGLVPELRGDIFKLLESLDDILDTAKENMYEIDIERPEVPQVLFDRIYEILDNTTGAVENVVLASKAFLTEPKLVDERLHRVYYHEKEIDHIAYRLKKDIFHHIGLPRLSHKQHLARFIRHLESLSDTAESVADLLTVAAIKRTI